MFVSRGKKKTKKKRKSARNSSSRSMIFTHQVRSVGEIIVHGSNHNDTVRRGFRAQMNLI